MKKLLLLALTLIPTLLFAGDAEDKLADACTNAMHEANKKEFHYWMVVVYASDVPVKPNTLNNYYSIWADKVKDSRKLNQLFIVNVAGFKKSAMPKPGNELDVEKIPAFYVGRVGSVIIHQVHFNEEELKDPDLFLQSLEEQMPVMIFDACGDGDLEAVKVLIKANPDLVFSKDGDNGDMAPIHFAAREGHKEVIEYLLAHKADINMREGGNGKTALHVAALNGQAEVVKFLIDNKADVNAKDNDDYTPLHYAAKDDVKKLITDAGGQ